MAAVPMYRETNVRTFPLPHLSPHTPQESEYKDSSSRTTGGSSTTTTAQESQIMEEIRAKEAFTRVAAESIREQYSYCIGEKMSPALFGRILLDLLDGTPSEYYKYALDETSLAPHPSPRYMLAIVQRLKREKADPDSFRIL